MDELSSAIQLLQSQLVEQENTQPALNETNIIDIPNIQPYDSIIREQIRSLLQQQNVPEDQMEAMIQQQLNNISQQNDEGMM
jgi:hypothetical protein